MGARFDPVRLGGIEPPIRIFRAGFEPAVSTGIGLSQVRGPGFDGTNGKADRPAIALHALPGLFPAMAFRRMRESVSTE